MSKFSLYIPLAIAKGTNPVGWVSPVPLTALSMFADRITKVADWHTPIVTDKPLHFRGPKQLNEGQLEWFGERLHNVGANVVHGAFLDETLEEPRLKHQWGPFNKPPLVRVWIKPVWMLGGLFKRTAPVLHTVIRLNKPSEPLNLRKASTA